MLRPYIANRNPYYLTAGRTSKAFDFAAVLFRHQDFGPSGAPSEVHQKFGGRLNWWNWLIYFAHPYHKFYAGRKATSGGLKLQCSIAIFC